MVAEPLICIGYWCGGRENVRFPDPLWFVDESWERATRDRVCQYLALGNSARGYLRFSWCRFACGTDYHMGLGDLTDGTYIWPEGLSHYVEVHSVRLPDEFVEHVLSHELPQGIGGLLRITDSTGTCRGYSSRRYESTDEIATSDEWWCTQVGWTGQAKPTRREFANVYCLVPDGELSHEVLDYLASYDGLGVLSREAMADYVESEAEEDEEHQVRRLYMTAMGRDEFERRAARAAKLGLRLDWEPW